MSTAVIMISCALLTVARFGTTFRFN